MKKILFTAFFLAVTLYGNPQGNIPLFAQNPAANTTDVEAVHHENLWNNYRIDQEIRQFRQQPSEVTISTPQLPPQLLDEKSNQKVFKLNKLFFTPPPFSLTPQEIDDIAQKYLKMEKVSIRDLYVMLSEIDALFDARRVVGRAVLPVQDVENGVLYIQIIEGKIGKVTVTEKRQQLPLLEHGKNGLVNNPHLFGQSFVHKNFPMPEGSVLNLQELEDKILAFNRKFRTQIVAELEPGDEPGSSNLKLTAISPQPISAAYFCDSSGRETSGKIRNGFYAQVQNVFGADEGFFCSYDETEGTSYLTLSGDMPVSGFGTYADFSYSYGTPKTLYGAFADLGINGISERYRPALRQLLINTKKRKTDLSFAVENYVSETRFDTVVNYREKLTGYTLGISDIYRTEKTVRAASLSWQLGNAAVAGYTGVYEDDHYHLLNGSYVYAWYPNKTWTFIGKVNGQWVLTDVVQSRIFQIGGLATVRGVKEGLMSAESGYLLNLEARRALHQSRKTRIEAFGFFDHGGCFSREHPVGIISSDYLFSTGMGLLINLGGRFSMTMGYGHPLFTHESHKQEYRDALLHGNGYFTLQAQY